MRRFSSFCAKSVRYIFFYKWRPKLLIGSGSVYVFCGWSAQQVLSRVSFDTCSSLQVGRIVPLWVYEHVWKYRRVGNSACCVDGLYDDFSLPETSTSFSSERQMTRRVLSSDPKYRKPRVDQPCWESYVFQFSSHVISQCPNKLISHWFWV